MRWAPSRTFVLGATLLVATIPSEAGDPPPALQPPAPLVANPRVEGWSGFEPGAWIREEDEWLEPEAAKGLERFQRLTVLVEASADEVVLWQSVRRGERDPHAFVQVFDRTLSAEERNRAWTHVRRLTLARGVQPVVGVETIVETKERLTVADKELECRLLVVSVPAEDDVPLRRVRLWLNLEVPGGIARQEFESREAGERSRRRWLVVAYGRKPDGSFAFPVAPDAVKRSDTPTYVRWARAAIGSWIEYSEQRRFDLYEVTGRRKVTLAEVRPTRLLLAEETQKLKTESPYFRRKDGEPISGPEPPVHARIEVPRRSFSGEPWAWDDGSTPTRGLTLTTTEGREALVIRGRIFECTTVEIVATAADSTVRVRTREWLHPDVPGQLVKWERVEKERSSGEVTTTRLAETWGVPGK